MNDYLIEIEFRNFNNDPISFTNRLINVVIQNGQELPLEDENIDIFILNLEEVVSIFNLHLPKRIEVDEGKFNLILENFNGDIPLFISMLYLIDINNDKIPFSVINFNVLYKMVQKTYNEFIEEDYRSNYHLVTEQFFIASILDELRE
ncbi:hypothetical protein AB9K26_14475 [Psychroserpens sp. XS_ASV72]|uniref:hypothetical protein n=1 Tax=Psychroserpens sp. XS_ASV72 TaxID=3241293 RepID=UPI0035173E95